MYDREYPVGTVTATDPADGERVEPGATITLTLAAHSGVTTSVPDLLGRSAVDAEAALQKAGFLVDLTVEESCHGPSVRCSEENATVAGKVWRQDVAAGAQLPVGSHVAITVGPGG